MCLKAPGVCISTTPSSSVIERLAVPRTVGSAKLSTYLKSKTRRKSTRRRLVRATLLLSNVAVLAAISIIVLQNPHDTGLPKAAAIVGDSSSTTNAAKPLDSVSSADVALMVARLSGLPETKAITNQAQSQAATVAIAASNDSVVSKPQVVATALKSRADIKTYTSVAGDTLASLAAKFSITSDSIRWSNNLSGETIPVGTKLTIPPVNGIIYTVKAGDTVDSLAARYGSSRDKVAAFNDAEIKGLQTGQQIVIPDGTQQAAVATTSTSTTAISSRSFPWGTGPMYGVNGYDYGYCTWYVATQVNVPGNWGNASTWAYYAGLSGWNVSKTPTVGAIAQKGGGEGHVAIVTGVNPDGTVVVRDMNGFAGWGRVGSGTVSAGFFQNFITQ